MPNLINNLAPLFPMSKSPSNPTPAINLPARPPTWNISAPSATIERKGRHHGTGLLRVAVGNEVFSGKTESHAIAAATIHILTQFKDGVLIRVEPPLP